MQRFLIPAQVNRQSLQPSEYVQPNVNLAAENDDVHEVLRSHFQLEHLRPGQKQVISAVRAGQDVFVLWSTAWGKSLCYQLAGILMGRTVLIISPLVSLMKDQCDSFNETMARSGQRHRACFLGEAQLNRMVETEVRDGAYLLVYITPEKLMNSMAQWKSMYDQALLGFVAVDESHCISEWGQDFRPAFRKLGIIREKMPGLPLMCLTASATPAVQHDIATVMRLSSNVWVSMSDVDRNNLSIQVECKTTFKQDMDHIAGLLTDSRGSFIVYTLSRPESELVSKELNDRLSTSTAFAGFYHAGLPMGMRNEQHVALHGSISST